jgi:outer membrane immunogenic protein
MKINGPMKIDSSKKIGSPRRLRMRRSALLLALGILLAAVPAAAQDSSDDSSKFEVSVGYTWVHARAVTVNGCCFSMNGGSASFAYRANNWLSVVGDFSGVTNGNVLKSGLSLTVYPYTFGPRVSLRKWKQITPYGQALFGGGHASGTLYTTGSPTSSRNAFAMELGGGVDANITHHFAVRLAQVDYLFTTFQDGFTNHEHNLRITTGVVFRFGEH